MSLAKLIGSFGRSVEYDPADIPRPAIARMVKLALLSASASDRWSEGYERQRRERDTPIDTDFRPDGQNDLEER